ncbi:MAG: TolC family protein, partial [Pseudomonadota bacterium]
KGPPDDAQIAEWVRTLTAGGLTRARAVEIALVNNRDLQATYEELGISQADMVQAGLLKNPSFGAELGFRTNSGANDELRLSLVQDFLDLFVLPLRKEIARAQFEADTLRVAHRALEIAADVEKSFAAAQAGVDLVAFRQTVVDAWGAAAELSQRQFEAGNISALDQQTQRATYEQARLDLAREEVDLLEARERVNRLLGLWGETTSWRVAETLPPLPASEPKVEHLESLAMRQRLDVAVARRQAALLAKAVDLARTSRLFGRIEVGVDMHRDPNGPRLLGPSLVIDLPIFDQRQAVIARLEAQQRQQQRRLSGVAIDARSEVRLAEVRLRTGRQTVLHYRDILVPLRKAAAEQALLHYNGMFIGLFQLVAIKQEEVEARRRYLEALRDYWSLRAELARAVGGGLPVTAPTQPAPSPSSAAPARAPSVTPAASEGSHHEH